MTVNPPLLVDFLALSVLLSAIPGLSVWLEMSRSITRGRASAMWIVLGNFIGGMPPLGLALCGLGAVVEASVQAFLMPKRAVLPTYSGSACGLCSTRGSRCHPCFGAHDARPVGSLRSVRQGFLGGVADPQASCR